MIPRVFWDSNANVLRNAQVYKRDWDSANNSVQDTIKAIGDVLLAQEQNPEKIHEIGLDISIQTIENSLERMQEIQLEAQRLLMIYDNNTIKGLSVKNVQSITATTAEALTALVAIVSQVSANIGNVSSTDRTASNVLNWVALAGYGSALALSAVKERLLRAWRANEEKAGKLRSLVDQADHVESIQGTCQILKEFKRAITPAQYIEEHEWPAILSKVKQVPKPFQRQLSSAGLQIACVNTPGFRRLERIIRQEVGAVPDTQPVSLTSGVSPTRQKLMRAVDKIRAQQAATPATIPFF